MQERDTTRSIRHLASIVWVGALLSFAAGDARAEDLEIMYYDIVGTRAGELRDAMDRQGPWDTEENIRYDARTDWFIVWYYKYALDDRGCRLTSFEVNLEVEMILPRWKNRDESSAELVREWDRYSAALREHEEGHRQNGRGARDAIAKGFERLGTYRTCKKLEAEITKFTDRLLEKYQALDARFDRETDHGLRQGAELPR